MKRSAWVTWSQVEDGFYIGSRFGHFVGYIDRRDGVYSAFNLSSVVIGTFTVLADAMDALAEAAL